MRERLRISDLTILYVCLSDRWTTKERRCISDANYFRNIGGTAILLCNEKSYLDKEAEKEDIPRIYFSAGLDTIRSQINFYFQLQQILQKQQIDIIHTYDHETLMPFGLALRSLPQIPLVFTFNNIMGARKFQFLDRWFSARTDSILTFSETIKEIATECFPVPSRKIHVTGMGVDFPSNVHDSIHTESRKKIITFISRAATNIDHIKVFIDGVVPLLHQLEEAKFKQQLIFTFMTDISWYDHPLYDILKRVILERQLEMYFNFESRPLKANSFIDCDVFVGIPLEELFTDLDLYSLVTRTPVLLPRTSTRQQIVKQGKFGETYHPEDGRELKIKLFKILTNYSRYLDELDGIPQEIFEKHHFEYYSEMLYSHYEKLFAQRLRYTQKKRKLT